MAVRRLDDATCVWAAARSARRMSTPPTHLLMAWLVLGPVVAAAAAFLLDPRWARRLAAPFMVSFVAAAAALAAGVLAAALVAAGAARWLRLAPPSIPPGDVLALLEPVAWSVGIAVVVRRGSRRADPEARRAASAAGPDAAAIT